MDRNRRKGSEWWNEQLSLVVAGKRRADEVWLQGGNREAFERYRVKRKLAKRMMRKAKREVDMR